MIEIFQNDGTSIMQDEESFNALVHKKTLEMLEILDPMLNPGLNKNPLDLAVSMVAAIHVGRFVSGMMDTTKESHEFVSSSTENKQ